MARGAVKWFNDDKGYGFIKIDIGPDGRSVPDVFVHHTAIEPGRPGFKSLKEDERVEFDIEQGPKGPQASNVKRA